MMELPKAALEILLHLEGCEYSKVIDLPVRHLNADIVTLLDYGKAVEFQDVEGHERPKANLWFSYAAPGYKPWRELLPEVISQRIAAVIVRITPTGRAELARHRVTNRKSKESSKKGAWFGNAVTALKQNPGWNDARIASEIGISPSTLTRSREWQRLREADCGPAPARGGMTDETIDSFTDDYRKNR